MDKKILYSNTWNEDVIDKVKGLPGPILVVGVSGFIGAGLFHALSAHRKDIYGCSRFPFSSWRLVDANQNALFSCDITDFNNVRQIINRIKPQTVFNLAVYGAYSRQADVEKIHQTNYIGTLNLIRVLLDTGCTAFVHAGTSSEYGVNCSAPKEDAIPSPNSDYAVSKLSASYLINYYGKTLNFPAVNLRLYSIYGAFEEKDRLIPALVSAAQNGGYPNFANKDISRDFVYLDDCMEALILAAGTVCRTNPGISINIASGKKMTIEDVARTAKKVFELKDEPTFGVFTQRKWDLQEWYGNATLAKKLLNWKTKTSFEEGLKLTSNWWNAAKEYLISVTHAKSEKKISAIMACYKDNEAIPVMYQRLTEMFSKVPYDYEIIFVNDRSPANDEEIISEICAKDTHVIGVSHSRNFGSQSAFLSGMEVATGDAVVLMDGDGQDPPEVIPKFIAQWENGFDVVYGNRVKREAPFYMQVLYKMFYRIFSFLADVKIPLDAGDFSLIDKKVVTQLLNFQERDVFLRGLRAWVGFKQTGVDYVRPERLFGVSTNSFFKNIWWAKKGIYSFSSKPLAYMQAFGVLTFILTILLGLYYLVNYFVTPNENHVSGVMTIVMLLLGIGSILIISLSIIGDYIGKIIEEVKARPKFIRDKIFIGGNVYADEEEIKGILNKRKNI